MEVPQVTAAQMERAMQFYGLSVFQNSPSVPEGARWHARDDSGNLQGFGATPSAAVEAAVSPVAGARTIESGAKALESAPSLESDAWAFLQ